MKIVTALLVILVVFTMSCNKDDNPVKTDLNGSGSTIMPFKVGNTWEGTFAYYDSTGAITFSNDNPLTTLFLFVKDTLHQGEHWYATSGASLPPTSFSSSMFLTVRSDGLWGRPSLAAGSVPFLIAKFPGSVNDSYLTGTDTNYRATLLSKNASITVPRGTYSCYHYRVSHKNDPTDLRSAYYMCPDSGFVRVDQFGKTASGRSYVNASWFLKRMVLYAVTGKRVPDQALPNGTSGRSQWDSVESLPRP